jgi:hypothetical protein
VTGEKGGRWEGRKGGGEKYVSDSRGKGEDALINRRQNSSVMMQYRTTTGFFHPTMLHINGKRSKLRSPSPLHPFSLLHMSPTYLVMPPFSVRIPVAARIP